MKKAVLFILIFSFNSIFAQELVKLFEKDLTDRIRFESYPKQLVNKDLDMASKIHPELLYYYITYHNLKYDGKIEEMYRLYDKELGEARSKFIKSRNKWFGQGEEDLKVMEKDTNQLAGELQYLLRNNTYKNLTIGHLCDSCYKTDINRLNYFVYKYYMKDSDLMYLPNEDYSILRKEYEAKIKTKLEADLKELSNSGLSFGSAENDYIQLIKFWFLFPDKNEKESIQAQYTKLLFNNYYKYFKISENGNSIAQDGITKNTDNPGTPKDLKIMLNFNNFNIRSFTYRFEKDIPADAELDSKYNVAANLISVGISTSINILEGDRMFSKLTLEAGFGVNTSEKTLLLKYPEELPPYSGSGDMVSYISNNMKPEKNYLKVTNILNVSFKVKTPILYVGRDLCLGIGGAADIFIFDYSANMDFYLIKMLQRLNYVGQVVQYSQNYYLISSKGEEDTKVFPKFYPILTAEYKLPWNFNLNCEASLDYYMAGFSYNLQ